MEVFQSDSDAIDIAVSRFMQERYEESNKVLYGLVTKGVSTSFINFCIGRNYLHSNDYTKSSEWFKRSLATPNPFRWTYYEFARLRELENDAVDAARLAEHFARSYSDDRSSLELNEHHRGSLLRIAHRCFNTDRAMSVPLYRALSDIGVHDYLSTLRIIESDLDLLKIEAAHERMTVLMNDHTLDAWGEFALSRIQFAQGNLSVAVETTITAADRQPNNHVLRTTAVHRLLEFKALQDARSQYERMLVPLLDQSPELDAEIKGIDFRINVLSRDHKRLLAACSTAGFLAAIPNWLAVEALFNFALPGEQINQLDIAVATELANFLEAQFPYSLGTILSLYQFYSRRRLWHKIAELEARIADDPQFNHHEVVMRRFETLCARSQMDEARLFYEQHYANTTLKQWESCVVLRFLAEAKMWDEAAELLKQFIANRYYFPDGDYFLMKICRRTGIHRELLNIIEENLSGDIPEQFPRLHRLLRDDLVLKGAQGAKAAKAAGGAVISSENRVLYKAAAPKTAIRIAGFLCADKAYYMSVLTFLSSYAANSVGNEGIQWYVFLAKDVPKTFYTIIQGFANKLELPLEIVREKEFVGTGVRYAESYGIFTGGNTLSRAAFLRIYAAKYLFNLDKYDRAFYIDSDIICQREISSFVTKPFDDALLMARAEEPSPEVRSVTEKHGIGEMTYFNSGVLVFNFLIPTVIEHIEEALRISETEPARLVFHDQCALNIAFAEKVSYLESDFNFFLRPHRPDNGDFTNAVFLHFLDKPKPWDISYSREYRAIWVRYAELVRVLLTNKNYNLIASAANP